MYARTSVSNPCVWLSLCTFFVDLCHLMFLCVCACMCVPQPAAGPEAPAPAEPCVSGCPGTPPASRTSEHTASGSPSSKLPSPFPLTKTHRDTPAPNGS